MEIGAQLHIQHFLFWSMHVTLCILLRMENDEASENVLKSVELYLQTYPFSYQGARIITGQEEGAFGWITVNYLSDNLRKVLKERIHSFFCTLINIVDHY